MVAANLPVPPAPIICGARIRFRANKKHKKQNLQNPMGFADHLVLRGKTKGRFFIDGRGDLYETAVEVIFRTIFHLNENVMAGAWIR